MSEELKPIGEAQKAGAVGFTCAYFKTEDVPPGTLIYGPAAIRAQARAEALEEAAKICAENAKAAVVRAANGGTAIDDGWALGADECARELLALAAQPKEGE